MDSDSEDDEEEKQLPKKSLAEHEADILAHVGSKQLVDRKLKADNRHRLKAIRQRLSKLKDRDGNWVYPDYEFKKNGRLVRVQGVNAVPWSAVYKEEHRLDKYNEEKALDRVQGLAQRRREQQRSEMDTSSESSFPSITSETKTKKATKGAWGNGVSAAVKTKTVVKKPKTAPAVTLATVKLPTAPVLKDCWADDSEEEQEEPYWMESDDKEHQDEW